MPVNLGEAVLNLTADSSGLSKGLSEAERQIGAFGGKTESTFKQIATTALGMFGGGVLLAGMSGVVSGLKGIAAEAFDAYTSYERLGLVMETLAAKEIRAADSSLTMEQALAGAKEMAKETVGWIEELAIKSPFTSEGVASAFRMAQAYGFATEEAKRMTQAMIDFAAGSGASEATMARIAMVLGQIKAAGRLLGQDMMQLTSVGLPVVQILADAFKVTTAEIIKMREKGLIPAQAAIEAITQYLETNFAGAAVRQATSWSGLLSTFQDIKSIGLRELFSGIFDALHPLAIALADLFTPELRANLRAIGDEIGGALTGAINTVTTTVQILGVIWDKVFGGLEATIGRVVGSIIAQFNALTNAVGPVVTGIGMALKRIFGIQTTAAEQTKATTAAVAGATKVAQTQLKGVQNVGKAWGGVNKANDEAGKQMIANLDSYVSKAQDAAKGLFDVSGGGLGDITKPGANGPFENIYRALDVAKRGTESPWAKVLGLTQEDAMKISKDFQAGIFSEGVKSLIDVPALVEAIKTQAAAEQMKKKFIADLAKAAGVSPTAIDAFLTGATGGGAGGEISPAIAEAAENVATGLTAALTGPDVDWGIAGKGIADQIAAGVSSDASATAIADAIVNAVNKVSGKLKDIKTLFDTEGVPGLWRALVTWWDAEDGGKKMVTDAATAIGVWVGKVAGSITTNAAVLGGMIQGAVKAVWVYLTKEVFPAIETAFAAVKSFFAAVFTEANLATLRTTVETAARDVWSFLVKNVFPVAQTAIDAVASFFTSVFSEANLVTLRTTVENAAKDVWGFLVKNVFPVAQIAIDAVASFFTSVFSEANLATLRTTVETAAKDVWSFLVKNVFPAITDVVIAIGTWIDTNVVAPLTTNAVTWGPKIETAAKAVWKFLTGNVFPAIADVVIAIGVWIDTNVVAPITTNAVTWGPKIETAAKAVWGFLVKNVFPAIADVVTAIGTWIDTNVVTPITTNAVTWGPKIATAAKAVWAYLFGPPTYDPISDTTGPGGVITTWWTGWTTYISDKTATWGPDIKAKIKVAWDYLFGPPTYDPISGTTGPGGVISTWWASIVQYVKDNSGQWGTDLKGALGTAFDAIATFTDAKWATVPDTIKAIAGALTGLGAVVLPVAIASTIFNIATAVGALVAFAGPAAPIILGLGAAFAALGAILAKNDMLPTVEEINKGLDGYWTRFEKELKRKAEKEWGPAFAEIMKSQMKLGNKVPTLAEYEKDGKAIGDFLGGVFAGLLSNTEREVKTAGDIIGFLVGSFGKAADAEKSEGKTASAFVVFWDALWQNFLATLRANTVGRAKEIVDAIFGKVDEEAGKDKDLGVAGGKAVTTNIKKAMDPDAGWKGLNGKPYAENIATAIQAGVKPDTYADVGKGIVSGVAKGVDAEAKKDSFIANFTSDYIIDPFENALLLRSPSQVFADYGADTVTGYVNGLKSKIAEVEAATKAIVTAVQGAVDWGQVLVAQGESLLGGLIQGIRNEAQAACDAMAAAIEAVKNAAAGAAKSKSPSKVFAEVGKDLVDGMAKGIEDNSLTPIEAFTALIKDLIAALSAGMGGADAEKLEKQASALTAMLDAVAASVNAWAAYTSLPTTEGIKGLADWFKVVAAELAGAVLALQGRPELQGLLAKNKDQDNIFQEFADALSSAVGPFQAALDFWMQLADAAETRAIIKVDVAAAVQGLAADLAQVVMALRAAMHDPRFVGLDAAMVDFATKLSYLTAPFQAMADTWRSIEDMWASRPSEQTTDRDSLVTWLRYGLLRFAQALNALMADPALTGLDQKTADFAYRLAAVTAPFQAMADTWRSIEDMQASRPEKLTAGRDDLVTWLRFGLLRMAEALNVLQRDPALQNLNQLTVTFSARLAAIVEPFQAMADTWQAVEEMWAGRPEKITTGRDDLIVWLRYGLLRFAEALNVLLKDPALATLDADTVKFAERLAAIVEPFRALAETWQAVEDMWVSRPKKITTGRDDMIVWLRYGLLRFAEALNALARDPALAKLDDDVVVFAARLANLTTPFAAIATTWRAVEEMWAVRPKVIVTGRDTIITWMRYALLRMAEALNVLLKDPALAGLDDDMVKFAERLGNLVTPFSTMLGFWTALNTAAKVPTPNQTAFAAMIDTMVLNFATIARRLAAATAEGGGFLGPAILPELTDEVLAMADNLSKLIAPFTSMLAFWTALNTAAKVPAPNQDAFLKMLDVMLLNFAALARRLTAATTDQVLPAMLPELTDEVLAMADNLGKLIAPFVAMLSFWTALNTAAKVPAPNQDSFLKMLDAMLLNFTALARRLDAAMREQPGGGILMPAMLPALTDEVLAMADSLGKLVAPFSAMLGFWTALNTAAKVPAPNQDAFLKMLDAMLLNFAALAYHLYNAMTEKSYGGMTMPAMLPKLSEDVLTMADNLGKLIAPFTAMLSFWTALNTAAKVPAPDSSAFAGMLDAMLLNFAQIANKLVTTQYGPLFGLITEAILTMADKLGKLIAPFTAMLSFWMALDTAAKVKAPDYSAFAGMLDAMLLNFAQIANKLVTTQYGPLFGLITEAILTIADTLGKLIAPFSAMLGFWTDLNTAAKVKAPTDEAFGLLIGAMLRQFKIITEKLVAADAPKVTAEAIALAEALQKIGTALAAAVGFLAGLKAWRVTADLETKFARFDAVWRYILGILEQLSKDTALLAYDEMLKFTETMRVLSENLTRGIGFLIELDAWKLTTDLEAKAKAFSEALLLVVTTMAEVFASPPDVAGAEEFATAIGNIINALTGAFDLLDQLRTAKIEPIPADVVSTFVGNLAAVILQFITDIVQKYQTEVEPEVLGAWGVAVGQVSAGLLQGVTLLDAIAVTPPETWTVDVGPFMQAMSTLIGRFIETIATWGDEKKALLVGAWGTAVGQVSAGLLQGVALLNALAVTPAETLAVDIGPFMAAMAAVVSEFIAKIVTFGDEKKAALVEAWGTAVGAMSAGLLAGLELLKGIATYVDVPNAIITAFMEDMAWVVGEFIRLIVAFGDEQKAALVGAWGEAVGKMSAGLLEGLNLLNAIRDYKDVADTIITAFMEDMAWVVGEFIRLIVVFGDAKVAALVGAWGEAVGRMSAGLLTGLELLQAVRGYKDVLDAEITAFMTDMAVLVGEFIKQITTFGATTVADLVAAWGGAVGAMSTGLLSGINTLQAIRGYKALGDTEIGLFMADMQNMVGQFIAKITTFGKTEVAQLVLDWGTAVGAMSGGLKTGLELLSVLATYRAVPEGQLDKFMLDITAVVTSFAGKIPALKALIDVDAVKAWGDAIGALMKGLNDGLVVLSGLTWYNSPADGKLEAFIEDVKTVIVKFRDELVPTLTDEQLTAVAAFAGVMTDIFDGVQTAIGTIKDLLTLTGVEGAAEDPQGTFFKHLQDFNAALIAALGSWATLIDTQSAPGQPLNPETMAPIVKLAEVLDAIFSKMETAINGVAAIVNLVKGTGAENLTVYVATFNTALLDVLDDWLDWINGNLHPDDPAAIEALAAAMSAMDAMLNYLTKAIKVMQGAVGLVVGTTGENLTQYITNFEIAMMTALTNWLTWITGTLAPKINVVATAFETAIGGEGGLVDRLQDAINLIVTLNTAGVPPSDNIKTFLDTVIGLLGGFVKGINDQLAPMETAIGNFATGISTAVADKFKVGGAVHNSIKATGASIGEGFEAGVIYGAGGIPAALKKIVDDAIAAIKLELGIASPSKVFADLGAQLPAGLVQGILGGRADVEWALADLQRTANFAGRYGVDVDTERELHVYLHADGLKSMNAEDRRALSVELARMMRLQGLRAGVA